MKKFIATSEAEYALLHIRGGFEYRYETRNEGKVNAIFDEINNLAKERNVRVCMKINAPGLCGTTYLLTVWGYNHTCETCGR